MRRLLLNLLSLSATLVVLAALTVPAIHVIGESRGAGERASTATAPSRLFGVAVDPWHVDDWSRAVGAKPTLVAKFQAFARRGSIQPFLDETERQGIHALMVSWEPWKPVPASLGRRAQFTPQPGFRNRDIARGEQDAYITSFARALARFDGTVYVRYAHEMNGIWYPWTHDPRAYRRAWRHVVRLFRDAGARNVRFVWSTNPNLYEAPRAWMQRLRRYWPGSEYVDYVGSTTIDFGGRKDYGIDRFAPRLRELHGVFGKPLIITEANTDFAGRVQWLDAFREMLHDAPWIEGVVWSQLPSRGKAQMPTAGLLDWDASRDPAARAVLRGIIGDGTPPRAVR